MRWTRLLGCKLSNKREENRRPHAVRPGINTGRSQHFKEKRKEKRNEKTKLPKGAQNRRNRKQESTQIPSPPNSKSNPTAKRQAQAQGRLAPVRSRRSW